MTDLGDPTGWTDREREFFAEGWNECLKMQPGEIERLRAALQAIADENIIQGLPPYLFARGVLQQRTPPLVHVGADGAHDGPREECSRCREWEAMHESR